MTNTNNLLTNIVFLFPCFCCLFWGVTLLCRWKQNLLPAKFGAIALLLMGISLLFRVISLTNIHSAYPILETFCSLSFFSCIVLSVRTLTNETSLSPKYLLLFLPGLLIGGTLAFLYFFIEEEKIPFLMQDILFFKRRDTYPEGGYMMYFGIYRFVYKLIMILIAAATLLYARISIHRYRERLGTFFSSPEDKSLEQGQALMNFLFAAVLYSLFILEWEYLVYLEYYTVIGLCLFFWGCALFYLGYHLSLLRYTAADFAREQDQVDWSTIRWEEQEDDDPDQWSRIRQKILPVFDQLMDEEHLFLRPNLRLDDVAQKAQTNRNYISILLREEHQCGFPEYINRRRIEYARYLIHLHPNLTQEQIAERCGYIYTSSFSRIFKQYTGTTFREWVKTERK